MIIELSLDVAKQLGLVFCKHCGHAPNNHFTSGKKTCAHCHECPGYELGFRRGIKLIKR